jgi:hypothetical protein
MGPRIWFRHPEKQKNFVPLLGVENDFSVTQPVARSLPTGLAILWDPGHFFPVFKYWHSLKKGFSLLI